MLRYAAAVAAARLAACECAGDINSIDPPEAVEQRVLRRIAATRTSARVPIAPRGNVEVTPLLPPFALAADGRRRVDFAQGSEHEIAILFADIRGFTTFAEHRLPYDVVFVLNQYFAAMGQRRRTSRRPPRQIHRRRGDGAVRAGQRPGAGLPRSAGGAREMSRALGA